MTRTFFYSIPIVFDLNSLKKRLFIILISLFIISTPLFGQEHGRFNIRNYSSTEYNAFVQNWAAIQDNQGIMYFANGDGVLKYDGVEWQIVKASNSSLVRSIAKDQSGIIYVGGTGDFGYLQQSENGKTIYISLVDKLNDEDKKFLEVWFIQTIGPDVYFCTYNTLFCLHEGKIKTWKTTDVFLDCFTFNNHLYVYEYSSGIKSLVDDLLVLIPEGAFFKKRPFRLVLPFESNKLLIITSGFGSYIYDFAAMTVDQKKPIISSFQTEIDGIISNSYPYNGIRLKDGNYALCLVPFGIAVINKEGKLLHLLNKESGLQTESVTNVYEDNEKNLWLTLSQGISKVDINSSLTSWNDRDGFELINDITRFNKSIYLGCLNGLFKLKNNKFIREYNYETPIFSLLSYNVPNNSSKQMLLVGTEFDGIVEFEKNKATPILATQTVAYVIFQSKVNPSYLYIGESGCLEVAHYENNTIKLLGSVDGVRCEVRSIVEELDGTIWCSNLTNLVVCIKPSGNFLKPKQIIEFKNEEGVLGSHDLFMYNEKVIIGTESGIRCLNEAKNKFIPDNTFGKEYSDGTIKNLGFNVVEKTGDAWIFGSKNKCFGIGLKNSNSRYDWYESAFNALPDNISPIIYIEADSTFWISTNEVLFRFKGDLIKQHPSYKTIIKKVTIRKDSTLNYDGLRSSNEESSLSAQLAYKYNSISFSFTALTYYNESSTLFQTYLEGFDNEWTDWTKESKKEYTNLAEGSYIFHVRAKNLYDTIGQEASYIFTIMPPWHRTIWAIILYFIALAGIIIVVINLYTKRLKAANIKLERIVNQRTIEIQTQRDELVVLNSTKDKFFGIIAHDLRNPFNSILGFSELVIDKLKKEDVKTSLIFMQHLHKASTSAFELLDNLLTWSRSQSGVIQFSPEILNIKKQIDYSIIMLEGSAQIKGIKLSSNLSNNLFVYADINMLLTILRNLLTNAIKFSNNGACITVDAKESDNNIIVSVSDTGIGLSEDKISKLFRVEEHVKTEGTAKEPGTGLGLILCKEFVAKNNGKIWVESIVDQGSCFYFTLQKGDKD